MNTIEKRKHRLLKIALSQSGLKQMFSYVVISPQYLVIANFKPTRDDKIESTTNVSLSLLYRVSTPR